MSEPESDAKVIQLPESEPDRVSLKPREWSKPRCHHERAIVDEDARTLECSKCAAPLDPIGFLVSWSKTKISRRNQTDRLEKLRADLTVHGIGKDGERTICGMGQSGRWTLTMTNRVGHVSCRSCRKKMGSLTHVAGQEVLLGQMDE
jgi:transcription elongation factor Elf1